jgi:GNAT superfamily N-acetyltransferase
VSDTITIRPATGVDFDAIAETVGETYAIGPVAEWLIPDATVRRRVYTSYAWLVLGLAHTQGALIHITTDHTAAALWYPPAASLPAFDDYRAQLEKAVGHYAERLLLLEYALDRHHPATRPHHYLAVTAVTPIRQRQGLGSMLLQHHHAYLDEAGMPAYLVATSPANRDFYLRHGYRTTDTVTLPDSGPPVWQMWREPTNNNLDSPNDPAHLPPDGSEMLPPAARAWRSPVSPAHEPGS